MQFGFSSGNQGSGKRLFTPSVNNKPSNIIEYDKSLIALVSSWGGLICDLRIQAGELFTEIVTTNTPPQVSGNDQWIEIVGQSNAGSFSIFMQSDVVALLLQQADHTLNISKLEGGDAALIFEHIFTDKLNALENLLSVELSIASIADVEGLVKGELLGFEFELDGNHHQAALQVRGELHNILEASVAHQSFPDEKNIDNKLIVHLGPVVVPARQAYLARVGEIIDCGVEPSSIIKGVLMRSDGRYWPIFIEDEQIEIAGPLAGPVQTSNEATDQIFVTFGLGETSLSAYDRQTLNIGSKVNIQRLPNNGANIYYQARPFGQGHLSILGSNLAVTLESVGVFTV